MATDNAKRIIEGNEKYVKTFDKGHLAAPPAKKYAIVTCMDARIDTFQAFGIELGDAHIIRNAGGNAKDALRSVLISQHLLGTTEVILIKHTKCGMLTFQNKDAAAVVAKNCGPGKLQDNFDFQPFKDLDQGVKDDVEYLEKHGALVPGATISGWVYDVETAKVRQVV
ncbi:Beta-carbonic anhydrase 1 [Teratosphaeria destructans]|uniref:Carbonic anhydrase n=1 Tax=Teratosphaeria destructans TaxID=418781 RepID=A0A9W7W6Y2_9PEZI|nr:Beta-carbonic anhydrase 1 [Teratosphaeria destructans]